MIRGRRSRRIARSLACVAAVFVMVPASAGAQSAVDEYSLDIPGAGGGGGGGGHVDPGVAAGASGEPTGSETGSGVDTSGSGAASGSGGDGSGDGRDGENAGKRGDGKNVDGFDELHGNGGRQATALDTSSRSAPEVIADSLFDGPMLPVLAALVLITGFGAWRVLRSRGTLSRQAG
jgi:hypothetical protein